MLWGLGLHENLLTLWREQLAVATSEPVQTGGERGPQSSTCFPVTCVLHICSTSSSAVGSDKMSMSASARDGGLRGLGSESRSASVGLCNCPLGEQACFELSHLLGAEADSGDAGRSKTDGFLPHRCHSIQMSSSGQGMR